MKTGAQTVQHQGGVATYIPLDSLSAFIGQNSKYQLYRQMRKDPSIALARVVALSPILVRNWVLQTSEPRLQKLFTVGILPIWKALLQDLMYAVDYGWMPFEKLFGVQDGLITYRRFKPLLHDLTQVRVQQDGTFAGLKQKDVELTPEECLVFTYDKEYDNFYGRSRHENILENAWRPWLSAVLNWQKYSNKVARVIPLIEYPEGQSMDATGNARSNFEIAQMVLQNLGSGNGVTMPNYLASYVEDLARTGGIPAEALKAWRITFLEPKEKHGDDFGTELAYWDGLKFRGWLVPEKAVLQGSSTKSDSSTTKDWVVLSGQSLADDIMQHMKNYVIDPLVTMNFGTNHGMQYSLHMASLDPEFTSFYRDLLKSVFGSPQNADMLDNVTDVSQVSRDAGLPFTKTPDTIVLSGYQS